jgi:hypothetical protein
LTELSEFGLLSRDLNLTAERNTVMPLRELSLVETGSNERLPEGSEHFHCRGIGKDYTPGCFVCGGPSTLYHNISGFVASREAGVNIVRWFGGAGAILDYRVHEPNWIQVKIGSCDAHLPHLRKLDELTASSVITGDVVKRARSALTLGQFREKVQVDAFEIWQCKKSSRNNRNWNDAVWEFAKERKSPSHEDIASLARAFWEQRQLSDSLDDWSEAERQIGRTTEFAF